MRRADVFVLLRALVLDIVCISKNGCGSPILPSQQDNQDYRFDYLIPDLQVKLV